jgi:hypothetical protein
LSIEAFIIALPKAQKALSSMNNRHASDKDLSDLDLNKKPKPKQVMKVNNIDPK